MKGRDVSLSEAIVKARGALEERLLPGFGGTECERWRRLKAICPR